MTFGELGGADNIPERRFAGRGGDADSGRAAVDVVGDVDAFRVAGERLDAARLGLREQRMVAKTMILQQVLQGAGAAAESQRVDRQDGHLRIDVIALVAGEL